MMAEAQRSQASFHFYHNPHAGSLLQGLQELRCDNLLTDVILCVHGKEIPCHRNVLAACSEYFHAMFCNGHRESKEHKVAIHEVSPDALQLLVDYAYTSEVTITEDNAGKLIEGANFFRILPVRDACVTFISNNLSAKDCLQMLHIGNVLSCPDLEKNARLCALKEFAAVSKTPEFLSLTKDQLVMLISSDDLNASEETVYTAVMTWINHDTRKRKKEMRELMEPVRFPFMDKLYFLENVERNEVVRKSCQDILTEAHRCQHFPGEVQSPRTRPRRISGLREAVVVIGGTVDGGTFNGDDSEYNDTITMTYSAEPTKSSWTTMRKTVDFNPEVDPVPVAVLGSSEIVMAFDGRCVRLYQPERDSWFNLARMNHVKRIDHQLAVLYGKVYAIGGREYYIPLSSVEVYDRSQHKWTEGVPLPQARHQHAVAVLDGSIYVMGGYEETSDETRETSTVYRFSPGDSQWQSMSDMPMKGAHISASALNGSIYAITGKPAQVLCSYTPGDDGGVWTIVASGIRESCGMTVFRGKIYILGGKEGGQEGDEESDKGSSEVVCFDPETRSLESVGTMANGLFDHACVTILKYC
ncbi:kelch-like protein 24a [Branchiostoma lanceolatum]|uniref:kelch-like protein 24a n=1 Tax=Branchiostoma lanceolatum TaxID=7740 RepID=UPI003451D591